MIKENPVFWNKDNIDSMIKVYGKKQVSRWARSDFKSEPTGKEIEKVLNLIKSSPFRLSKP